MNHNFSRRNLNTTRQLSGKLIYCKTQDTDLGWPSALIPALLLKHWCSFLITASAFDHSALKGTCFHWPPRSPFIIIFFYELHCCSSNVKPWTFRDLAHKWWSNIDNQLKPLRFHDQLELLLAIYIPEALFIKDHDDLNSPALHYIWQYIRPCSWAWWRLQLHNNYMKLHKHMRFLNSKKKWVCVFSHLYINTQTEHVFSFLFLFFNHHRTQQQCQRFKT